nr:PREDICTED: uncharacterized protein LOC108204956 isoform X1 [Daucus carota subsp. sativus]
MRPPFSSSFKFIFHFENSNFSALLLFFYSLPIHLSISLLCFCSVFPHNLCLLYPRASSAILLLTSDCNLQWVGLTICLILILMGWIMVGGLLILVFIHLCHLAASYICFKLTTPGLQLPVATVPATSMVKILGVFSLMKTVLFIVVLQLSQLKKDDMIPQTEHNNISDSDGFYHGWRSADFSLDSSLHSGTGLAAACGHCSDSKHGRTPLSDVSNQSFSACRQV